MGLLARLVTGLRLARGSLAVLSDHPKLFAFPAIGGVAGVVFALAVLGATVVGAGGEAGPVLYAGLFVLYVGSTFVAAFFTAALVHATRDTFRGREPSVRRSLAAAWRRRRPLLAWAVLAAVVGVVVRALEESNEFVARIVAAVFALGWAVMTYFVVPVIVFEDVGVRETFSRSGSIVRDVWGESLGAETGVGIVSFLLVALGVLVGVGAFVALPAAGPLGLLVALGVAATAVLFSLLFGLALSGVAKTALYVYATGGEMPRYFAGMDVGP